MTTYGKTRSKKNAKNTIQFTMMVCGTSGTGRSTFVNTLCGHKVLGTRDEFDPRTAHIEKGIQITPYPIELEEENGIRIALTVVDTPGFGNNIDNEMCFLKIVEYLERQYDEVLAEESRIRRNPRFRDNRVHVCLYFIEPTGHGLREMDVELMRLLSKRVNVIPVIGRADQLTSAEKASAKKVIMQDIDHYAIPIFNFPYDPEEDDEDTINESAALKEMLPFALVCGSDIVDGKLVRQHPWGNVEIENPEHSDFLAVRNALLGSHLTDLLDLTHDFFYESYRTEKLSGPNDVRGSRLLQPEDLANHSYMLKEEQLAREEEKIREIEDRVQREIAQKKLELQAREEELRLLEAKISGYDSPQRTESKDHTTESPESFRSGQNGKAIGSPAVNQGTFAVGANGSAHVGE
jgi:cell division control protein 11